MPSGATTTAERMMMHDSIHKNANVILADEKPRGLTIEDLTQLKVKETEQLIHTLKYEVRHIDIIEKVKVKKPRWKNGKMKMI